MIDSNIQAQVDGSRSAQPQASLRPARLAAEEAECRDRLARLGAAFIEIDPIRGEGDCGVASAIRVSRLAADIELQPEAPMNCQTALALGLWTKNAVIPSALAHMNVDLKAVIQNSTYVCRGRNNLADTKISEHAFGNAVDISGFRLADGRLVTVQLRTENETAAEPGDADQGPPEAISAAVDVDRITKQQARFQSEIRNQACNYFTTVLGPGTDAYHQDHFHFDLAARRPGYRYCR